MGGIRVRYYSSKQQYLCKRKTPLRCFLCSSDCELEILPQWHFQLCSSHIETVFQCGETRLVVPAEKRANSETKCCCCGLTPRRDAPSACTGRRTQAPDPTLTASGLATKRCASQSVLVFLYFDTTKHPSPARSLSDAAVVDEAVSMKGCAPSALLSVSTPEPAPADCCLTTETHRPPTAGRARINVALQLCHHPTHRPLCCLLLGTTQVLSGLGVTLGGCGGVWRLSWHTHGFATDASTRKFLHERQHITATGNATDYGVLILKTPRAQATYCIPGSRYQVGFRVAFAPPNF